jgi:hypothetical protein
LRQVFLFKLKPDRVVFRIGKVRDALNHPHYEKDCGVYPDRNTGIALFNLDERCPADGGALRRDSHGNTPPPPGVAEVVAQLVQGMPYRDRQQH